MRIAIDARAYGWTGIGRYIRSIVAQYAQLEGEHTYVMLTGAKSVPQLEHDLPDRQRFSIAVVNDAYYSWQEQTIFLWQLLQVPVDLYHFTHFNIPLLFTKPYVVTIHDTTRFVFSGQRRQSLWHQVAYETVFAHAVTRARHVIATSASTVTELQRLPIPRRPTTVIHEAVDPSYASPATALEVTKVRMLIGCAEPYLLYVGVWMTHKNLERLLEAFAIVLQTEPQLRLVMTGKPKPGYNNLLVYAQRLGISDRVIFLGYVPEALLPALYAEAQCLVFPSLYEGFGLPALEAAASGTPVVTSNVTSLPEVMGKAACYVNPESTASIAAGINKVLSNHQYRSHLIAAGTSRSQEFSWRVAAQRHLRVYEQAVVGNQ